MVFCDIRKEFIFVIIGGGIFGVLCVEYLFLLCLEEIIVFIIVIDIVKVICNFKKFGRILEEFDVEERLVFLLFE